MQFEIRSLRVKAFQMQADLNFHIGAAQEATSKATTGIPIWVYNFEFYSDNAFPVDYPFEKGGLYFNPVFG